MIFKWEILRIAQIRFNYDRDNDFKETQLQKN